VILYRGLKSSGARIMTMTLAFFIICSGIFVLQMSKINPKSLNQAVVDRKTTLLLETARHEVDLEVEKSEDEDEGIYIACTVCEPG
jgi:magnesium transporter